MKSPANNLINMELRQAMAVAHMMDDIGIAVLSVACGEGPAIVVVDRQPPNVVATRMVTSGVGVERKTSKSITLHGCRVTWACPAPCGATA
jgi:hypothetical protein